MNQLQMTMKDTSFTLVPAPAHEQQFCFLQVEPAFRKASIGFLRGDFGTTGELFCTTWFDENEALKTGQFKQELDNVVNALRQNGLLGSRSQMEARCNRFPDALIKTQWRKEMAFRMETGQHTYFLRCIPGKGDYNFYLYAFDKAAFMEALRQQKGLPLLCWSRLKSTGEVIAIKYGESGYHKWDTSGYKGIPSQEVVDHLNDTGGITKAQATAMEAGSMFGWHSPGADPRNYDKDGRFLDSIAKTPKERHGNER